MARVNFTRFNAKKICVICLIWARNVVALHKTTEVSLYLSRKKKQFDPNILVKKVNLTKSKRATMAPDSGGIPDQKEDDYGWSKSETGNKVA